MSFPASKCRDTVTLRSKTGNSARGAVYGNQWTEKQYLEPGFKQITDGNGKEIVASMFAVALPASPIKVGDEMTFDGRRYTVADVQAMRPNGVLHHYEVYYKSEAPV
jgi:hypothetical protein